MNYASGWGQGQGAFLPHYALENAKRIPNHSDVTDAKGQNSFGI